MKIGDYFSAIASNRLLWVITCGLFATAGMEVRAQAQHAGGGGTYFVAPGMRSEFQFNQAHVQCKVGHGVMPDGTVMQMFMFSTSVDSVTIDRAAKTVTLTGSMVSIVRLRFTDGTTALLSETVPYVAYAKDNSTTGAGADFFSLKVIYKDTPALDQFDLFGSPATFAGTLVTGNVSVK
jgi:hypothetical protein